jgi:hypothetical protein
MRPRSPITSIFVHVQPTCQGWILVLSNLQERGELCRALLYAVVLSPVLLTPASLYKLLACASLLNLICFQASCLHMPPFSSILCVCKL